MCLSPRAYLIYIAVAGLLLCNKAQATVVFEPGVGAGAEYTDNAGLTRDDPVDDTIIMGYAGARLSEDEGALIYDLDGAFNHQHYTQGTFSDQNYFNFSGRADWEMLKERFKWFLSDDFTQLPVLSLGSNTPDNIQDSNAFNLGADILFPVSARQTITIAPLFSQYYYEVLTTDNKQYALSAIWNYQMFRLTSIGLGLTARKINYTEKDALGQPIEDTLFTSLAFTFDSRRVRSEFTGSLGATNVDRDGGEQATGFSGFLNWLADLSSRSTLEASVSTELTDTSSVVASGVGNEVQISTDVVRNSLARLAYVREGVSLRTSISAKYNDLDYSDSPQDSVIRGFDMEFTHPVTQLLSSGAYVKYTRETRLDSGRLDRRTTVGGDLRYSFSRKLHGLLDLKYRKKESTFYPDNFDEFSVFVSLVYGFGYVQRPTDVSGW